MAERLRALAAPGEVVISDATKRLAAGYFDYIDLGIVSAKGFDEGVKAWRVVVDLPIVSRFEAQHVLAGPNEIVGRAEELARLSDALTSSLSGQGQAVCLLGDAGIGKSRLARAAMEAAARNGAATLTIDCVPKAGNTPLFPIGALLRRAANIEPTSSDAEQRTLARQLLARLLPPADVPDALIYLAPLLGLGVVALPANVGPGEVREQTISILVRMLNGLATEQPIAVLCEDLHWADDTTLSVLERVCSTIDHLPLLLLITTRPTTGRPQIDFPELAVVELQPLDPATAADLVRSLAKTATLSDESVRHIVERCEGVPLVIEEVTRSTLEAAIHPEDTAAGVPSSGEVPPPLQLVVESRLGRLPELATIARSASVLGREFSVRLLNKMMPNAAKADLDASIKSLSREGLFSRIDSNRSDHAQFKHAMICEAVYNTLLRGDRRRLHSKAADVLLEDYSNALVVSPDVLAGHLHAAMRFDEAMRVRLAASKDAASQGAYVESEGHCVAALTLVDEMTDPEERRTLEFQLLIQLGVALTGEQGYSAPVVEDAYRRARAICGDSAEAEMLYPVMRGLATINLVRGDLATAHDLALQGMQLAEQSTRTEFRLDAMSVLSYTSFYFGTLEECRGWICRCLDLYQAEQGDRLTYPVPQDAATAAIALLPTVAWLMGDWQAAEKAVADGMAHVERRDHDFDRALLHCWIAGARFTQRRYAEALEQAEIAAKLSQRHGYREWYGIGTLMGLLAQAMLSGDGQAVSLASAVYGAFASEGVGLNASYYLWGLARGQARAGDAGAARQSLLEAFKRAEASQETRWNAELMILQVELDPDEENATRLLAEALALADEQGAIATALRAAVAIALQSHPASPMAEYARAMLDLLDGSSADPGDGDWMPQGLGTLRGMLGRAQPHETS